MNNNRKVWVLVGTGAGIAVTVGLYFVMRSLKNNSSSANVKRVEAIIREAEGLIRQHK